MFDHASGHAGGRLCICVCVRTPTHGKPLLLLNYHVDVVVFLVSFLNDSRKCVSNLHLLTKIDR